MIAMNKRFRKTSPTGRARLLTTHMTRARGTQADAGGRPVVAAAGAPITAAAASIDGPAGGAVRAFAVHPTTAPRTRPARMRVCGTVWAAAMGGSGGKWFRLDYRIYPLPF